MIRPAKIRVARRRALTLLEILLVLALLVIVLAVAVPTLTGSLSNQRLKRSAETVRAAFSRARVKAMRSGQIQAFHCQLLGDKYATVPWYMTEDGLLADESLTSEETATVDPRWGLINEQTVQSLPDGIVFVTETEVVDERTQTVAGAAADVGVTLEGDDTPWSPPILFYPDGTTSDARVGLKSEDGWIVLVELRGLTGVARVGRPERQPDQFPQRR
jgi:Tfp pilus assembly protein FimT